MMAKATTIKNGVLIITTRPEIGAESWALTEVRYASTSERKRRALRKTTVVLPITI
jgi:hypothetical protein